MSSVGELAVEGAQLLRRDVEQELACARDLLPLARVAGAGLHAGPHAPDAPLADDPVERGGRGGGRRIVVDVGEVQADVGQPPGPPPPGAAPGLLDEAVLGELAEMEGARRRALADGLAGLGRRERAVDAKRVEQGEPDGMGERAHGARIGDIAGLVARAVERHISKDSSR